MKERISLTIDGELLREVDRYVNGSTILSRSHAIELLLKKALDQERVTQAFILAGGKGTRLRPYTYEVPKPLLTLGGRPILEHLINRLRILEIKNILLSVGHRAEKIITHFGDGSKFGVKIDYVIEPEPLGTGGPLRLAKNGLDNTFLMLNGDIVTNMDFQDIVTFHKESRALVTIGLVQVEDPAKYGAIELRGHRIIRFIEKPKKDQTPSKLVNAGVYVINKEFLKYIPDGVCMIEDLFHQLASQGILYGYVYSGEKTYWNDVGTQESYEKLIEDLQKGLLDWLT